MAYDPGIWGSRHRSLGLILAGRDEPRKDIKFYRDTDYEVCEERPAGKADVR